MAQYLGLTPVGWHVMLETWWDKVLAGILLSTIVFGSTFGVFLLFKKVRKHLKAKRQQLVVPSAVAKYLDDLTHHSEQLCPQRDIVKRSKSFGVFLGSFNDPPTVDQESLLSQWDIIVLDPLQMGVLEAISSQCTSAHILGRLDVGMVLKPDSSLDSARVIRSGNTEVMQCLGLVAQTLTRSFKRANDQQSLFTGVLLADLPTHFPLAVCNALIKYLKDMGLDVYIEISAPAFLTERQCREIDMELIAGIVCRNGTILPNGDRRNFFQMADMRTALRSLAAHSAMRDSIVMMWEIVEDGKDLEHSVVKRSFIWCNFSSAISWIGPNSALHDARIARANTVVEEPLGAMMWLKGDDVMKTHDSWRLNDKICREAEGNHEIYDSLESFIPNLTGKLALLPHKNEDGIVKPATIINDFDWPSRIHHSQTDPFSFSPHGHKYGALGCFQLGLDCSWEDFTYLLETQRRLRDLSLLESVKSDELCRIGLSLHTLYDEYSYREGTSDKALAIKELVDLLNTSNGDHNARIRVFIGLDSGFHTRLDSQFWGFYDDNKTSGVMDIYISGKTRDLTGTLLHTFMSSRDFTRAQCFMTEMALSKQTGSLTETWELPPRLVQDIEQLSPSEAMLFVQRLALSDCEECPVLSARVRLCLEYQLMEVPSLAQLRALNANTYLRNEISAEDLVTSRLAWYREHGCQYPDPSSAISLFREIDTRVSEVLMDRESQVLSQIEIVLQHVLLKSRVDASADFFALSVICAFRKLALDEIYLEVLDRNPLPNAHPDQAACFAEMFALGSRCENYFDLTPTALGVIISDKYRSYFKLHQPPQRDDSSTELPTAYASKLIDLDPDAAPLEPPMYYQVTFLGIFALPALIDIILLTTIGRGLYVTAYMTEVEKTMATMALMVSLLLCGAIGTWISSGGSYYLHSMAFPAMNMFVLTRIIAGIAVCLAGGALALIIIGLVKGFYAGLIFILYLCILTTYLSMLAALAIYQVPGFMFQSGRLVIMMCMPILLISPIVTLWVHHDILIYLCVLSTFLLSLIAGARRIMSQWSTWYLKVPCVTDNEVVDWYTRTIAVSDSAPIMLETVTDLAATPLPRRALQAAVLKEHSRRPWTKRTDDELVIKLAKGYSATIFLMDWYCKYSRTKMPYSYSPTWNLQCKAGVVTLQDMQKGLKLHNAFVHWRQAGNEVWCGALYFVIALLDKWVVLISGGSVLGLASGPSETFRLAVGFGLAYYLIGALFLDGQAQPLWSLANKTIPQPVTSMESLKRIAINDSKARRKLYWYSLVKFFLLHIWGLSVTSALMWSYEESRGGMVMYVSYIGAYTGLLWYQYNRIFTGPLALKDLLIAAALGLLTGPLLHHFLPGFGYNGVVSLAVGTWTAALLSLWTCNIGVPRYKDDKRESGVKEPPVLYLSSALGPHPQLSQTTLSEMFDSLRALPAEFRYRIKPFKHPGAEVMQILMSQVDTEKLPLVQAAFPLAEQLIHQTAEFWRKGETVIDLVPARNFIQQDQKIRSISQTTGKQLHIFVFISLDLVRDEWIADIRRNCKVIAEALIQATAEARLGLSHDHSMLAELLVVSDINSEQFSIPEGIKRQLENSATEPAKVMKNADKELLRYFLLGLDCDTEWDTLPKTVRSFLLNRFCGERCYVSHDQLSWMNSRFCCDNHSDVEEYIARCNLGASLTIVVNSFAGAVITNHSCRDYPEPLDSSYKKCMDVALPSTDRNTDRQIIDFIKFPFDWVNHTVKLCIKLTVVALVADPEYQRELDYLISGKPFIIRWPVTSFLNGAWIFCKLLQQISIPLFLFHGRENVSKLYSDMKGMKTVIQKRKIIIDSLAGPTTCFFTAQPGGNSQFHQYSGHHDQKPEGLYHLMAINTYTNKLVLRSREEYAHQALVNQFIYEYPQGRSAGLKLPMERRCISGSLSGQIVQYDERGYITSGSAIKDNNLVEFQFWYRKHAKFDDELLRAEYVFPHITIKVTWSVPPPNHLERLDKWIPHSKVMEATFIQGPEVYNSKWTYEHKFHPVILTMLNGQEVATPPMIQFDWFDVLQKPKDCSFGNDNPLFPFNSVSGSFFSRVLRRNTQWYPISTSRARTHLWKLWKNGKELDAVTTRWLDEIALRSDPVLKPYWRARDLGLLKRAEKYLSLQADNIMARVDIDPEISSWTPLAFKISDLYGFGQGGDSRINTRTLSTQMQDSDSELHVLAMDTGTWPNEGGGVSACRRDMVNNLDTIRWHVLAESANDFGVPKFQIEKNVQSLTILPLWGLDFLTPTHGVFQDCLDSAVQQKSRDTTDKDIIRKFIPILETLVRCSRALILDLRHIEEATKALVDLNNYFEASRHWSDVWKSDAVKKAWRELWLSEGVDNTTPFSELLEAERPTLLHLDQALDMWHRYLFIFSIPVPDKIPDVFQASHHFAGASYGVLCKVKRNCTLHVWDHCISWREVTVFLSSAMSFDPPFVCTALMSLSRLASVLILHHADVVLPCADFFNPGWEVEIGTLQGTIQHRRTFSRKIDPVVNGITDMERFKPIEKIKSKLPTVTMLSHVRFVKDIKTAILAADIIVNKWGFSDYRLDIYGDMEKAPTYSVECQEIIASKALRTNVVLKGLGSPSKVLEEAWIFLNSSVSEGLPLAMGEAALTGVPVVCTDVGASFRVVTDPITLKRFSAVVAPNDAESLAKAQINVLALLDEWSEFAEDAPGCCPKLSLQPTREEVERITKRMYEKTEQRRRLGMMGRNNVLSSFSSDRYLREHEQMLWIGKYQSNSYRARNSPPPSRTSSVALVKTEASSIS